MPKTSILFSLALIAVISQAPSQSRAGAAPGCAAAPPAPGLSSAQLESGGTPRRFSLYVPHTYTGDDAVPLIFDLHASGITPEVELQVTGLARAAERDGFVVALPGASVAWPRGGFTWNIPPRSEGPDDVAFIADLLDTLQQRFCIDPARVYVAGYSGGARLASQLACALPHRFAAIAAVAGLRHSATACRPDSPPVPVLAFHSIKDPVNPYRAAGDRAAPYWRYGVAEALRRWAVHNGCAVQPEQMPVAEGVERLRYSDCASGGALEFYRLADGGHTWPGSGFDFPDFVGATEERLDATAVMLRFFRRFRRPPG